MSDENPGKESPCDVLIHADAGSLAGKWTENLGPDEEAYWRVSGTPRQTEPGQAVWFEYSDRIYAFGTITAVEDGRLWFSGAVATDLPCPEDAPARGFTYIDPLAERLETEVA